MQKSKLAIVCFVLSLLPIVIPILLLSWTIITMPGDINIRAITGGFSYIFFSIILYMSFWFTVPSIILGVVSLVKIKKNKLKGKGFAIAGLIISTIFVIIFLLMLLQGGPYAWYFTNKSPLQKSFQHPKTKNLKTLFLST